MKKTFHPSTFLILFSFLLLSGCDEKTESKTTTEKETASPESNVASKQATQYREGVDYTVFERVRVLDRRGFAEPQEAYSMLLPTGWKHEADILWNEPGSYCAGTYTWFKASSADNKYHIEFFPAKIYSWTTNAEVMQFNQNSGAPTTYCDYREPMNAEEYLRKIFLPQTLENAEVIKMESNQAVIQQMAEQNEKTRNELMRYGAAQVQFDQTAISATVRMQGGEAFVVLGNNIIENLVPNVYNGTYDKSYSTTIYNCVVFKYPKDESELAKNQFSAIMGSVRTNPAWRDAMNGFWKNVREKKHVEHIGRIAMMDERTRQIGEAAVKAGNERLKAMDANMRSWEQQQSSQDRMHTNFVKTIREVEHYRDETGKIELASGYEHAWSRSDGASFILTNSPNFNPSSVFQDNRWKEMKKINE